MLPGFITVLMWLAVFIGVLAIAAMVLRKLHRKWTSRFGRRHYRIAKKPRKTITPNNQPSDMAKLSMDSEHIDDLLSSKPEPPKTSNEPPENTKKPPKRRKIGIN